MRSLDPNASEFEDHYAALGRFIVAFQQIEAVVVHWLSVITAHPSRISPNNLVQAMLANASFNNIQRFTALLPELLDPARLFDEELIDPHWRRVHSDASERLKARLKGVQTLEERRNNLIHSQWFTSVTTNSGVGGVFRLKHRMRKGKFGLWYEEVSAATLLQEAGACIALAGQLNAPLSDFHELSIRYNAAEGDKSV